MDYAFQELDALPTGYSVPTGRKKPWGTACMTEYSNTEDEEASVKVTYI